MVTLDVHVQVYADLSKETPLAFCSSMVHFFFTPSIFYTLTSLNNSGKHITPSTALIFEVRLNQNFVENLPRKNTTITTFHAVSKEGTGHFTDFPNFCYRGCFFVSCHSNLTEMSAAACQEGLFTCTITKRPGINTRMC
jgi:hypothetical protein